MQRKSGILLPVFSLPSKYGIGGFGKEACNWIDFLRASGQTIWQVLPLGPTGYGDSPYQSFSSFAGNPYFIDPDKLFKEGLLTKKECESLCPKETLKTGTGRMPEGALPEDNENKQTYIDYGFLYNTRFPVLRKACARYKIKTDSKGVSGEEKLDAFLKTRPGIYGYALYMACKNYMWGASWQDWPLGLRLKKPSFMEKLVPKLHDDLLFYAFIQKMFFEQWEEIKTYAHENGIQILGDLPIYLALDSADVWMHQDLFMLDSEGYPAEVSGVPPDAFSEIGQLWGNPLYNWELMKKDGYSWWMKRLEAAFGLFDLVRIDHFRGFESYYTIPYGEKTAVNGTWKKGPGMDFISAVQRCFGKGNIVAEDLGYLTDEVRKMLKESGFPGMKILLFAFDFNPYNEYLPHMYINNSVVYTGTHDNMTAGEWFKSAPKETIEYAAKYLGCNPGNKKSFTDSLIRAALSSVSATAIIPMQDWLGLGEGARINEPSTTSGNWAWRMPEGACTKELAEKIAGMTKLYGRCR